MGRTPDPRFVRKGYAPTEKGKGDPPKLPPRPPRDMREPARPAEEESAAPSADTDS